MDILFAQIQADLRSNDALRQSGALLQALQKSAAGRDISILAKSVIEEIIASPSSVVSKKLAFDLIRTTRLTSDLWDTVCTGITNDLTFPDPVGRLFQEFESKRMSRLAGDKLVDTVAIWSMVEFVWKRRNALMARSLVLPVESFRASVYPLVYGVKSVASGSIEAIMKLSRSKSGVDWSKEERFVGVSDVVTHLAPMVCNTL